MKPHEVERLYQGIGRRIKAARWKSGLTQEELATRIRMKRPSIVLIEQGRQKLPLNKLYRIAEVVCTNVHELLPPSNDVMDKDTKDPLRNVTFDEYTMKSTTEEVRRELAAKIRKIIGDYGH